MAQQIQAPDGSVVEFPDGMSDGQIAAVMRREYGGPKAPAGNTGIGFVDRSNARRQAEYERMQRQGAQNRAARAAGTNPIFQMGKDFAAPAKNALAGLRQGYDEQSQFSGARSIGDAVAHEKSGLKMIGNALALVASPITGALDAAVIKPTARGLEQIGLGDERANTSAINTAMLAMKPGTARAPIIPRPMSPLTETVQSFERAGVEPSLAAAKGKGAASVTNLVAENALAGMPARARLARQAEQAGAAARRQAGQYGAPRGAVDVGEGVQGGIRRFASDGNTAGTFKARSGELYDNAFAPIESAEQAAVAQASGKPVIGTTQSSALLKEIGGRINSGALSSIVTDPRLQTIAKALEGDAGALRFGDLRALRTWVREAKGNPQLRQNISQADLSRLEGSLTTDIYAAANRLSGPQALNNLRRADQYYAAGSSRIQNALKSFEGAKSGESAYSRIIQSAGSASAADIRKVVALKRSLAPSEWGDVAATVINNLGKPTAGVAGAADDAFSVSSFMTNYNKLSPQGREALFGSLGGGGSRATSLKAELDNLARVVDKLKAVERGANVSKSGVSAQNVASLAGLVNPITILPTMKVLGSMAGAGELLTNPAFVRWLARAPKVAAAVPAHLTRLDALVATYPQLAGYREELRKELNTKQIGQDNGPDNYQPASAVQAQLQPAP